jgi:UDP-glucuronate decarboxylase
MARIVVTGGAGFLGSHLCRALLDRGDQVVALDNLITGSVSNIESLFGRRGFTFVEHDVSQYVWVPGHVDVVMHFASPASPADFERIPIQILKVGGLGTHNCLGLAKAKDARFFLASTSEVYGDPQVHPQPETYWGHVNPIGPRGVYDEAKRYAEAMTMAYHRHHGLDVRIVRIFNSILADEQVLYDDGVELRRERVGDLAARQRGQDLEGYTVPAFDAHGRFSASETSALVGHPTAGPCFEVRTRYGRSIRVTGDHSLFVEGPDGRPVARPVTELAIGDRVAIAGRIDVPERDRTRVSLVDVWDAQGRDPWSLQLSWPELGEVVWERRQELLALKAQRDGSSARRFSSHWPRVVLDRDASTLTLAEIRHLGVPIPWAMARVRLYTAGRAAWLPAEIELTEELLWLLGLWVAEGCSHESSHDAFVSISGSDEVLLRKAVKVFERDLGLHVVWQTGSSVRSSSIFVHSRLLLNLWEHLGFGGNRKRIPGWILGLPLERLKWFVEGYREGDGVHSGLKFEEGVRHEFSTVSDDLKDDLIVALARFGICPSVGRYESTFKQRTGERRYPFWRITVPRVQPWSPLEWDREVTQTLRARRFGDIVWAAVREVVPIEATPLVYDFCVPGRENFWAGTGVAAHNTYGPSMRAEDGRAVSNFLVQALQGKPITVFGDGLQTRSFCYVDDEIRGFLALLDSDLTGPVNIGNPDEYTILQLAELAVEVTGSSSEIVFEPLPVDDPAQRQPDITIAREQLGWEPEIDLRTGLTRTAEYFRQVLAQS